jgi:hypothetical protein
MHGFALPVVTRGSPLQLELNAHPRLSLAILECDFLSDFAKHISPFYTTISFCRHAIRPS